MPAMTFTSVDLPAPLSPTNATTSPGRTSRFTPSSAWTGPKLLLTPSRARTGLSGVMESSLLSFAGRGRRQPTPPAVPMCLLDAGLLAGRGVRLGAYLRRLPERVLDDRVLDVVLGHGHRSQDHRRH